MKMKLASVLSAVWRGALVRRKFSDRFSAWGRRIGWPRAIGAARVGLPGPARRQQNCTRHSGCSALGISASITGGNRPRCGRPCDCAEPTGRTPRRVGMSTIESVLQENRIFPPPRSSSGRPTSPAWTLTKSVRGSGTRFRRFLGSARARARALAQAIHADSRRVASAVLQVVRRRRTERFLQLPRPASRNPAGQDRHHLRSRRRQGDASHLRELYQRVCTAGQRPEERAASRRATASSSTCRCRSRRSSRMQACARIGAIHSVVFGGFSAKSLAGTHHRRRRSRGDHRGRPVPRRARNSR